MKAGKKRVKEPMKAEKEETRAKEAVTANVNVLEDQIRKRAYELYLAREGGPGSDVDDWLRAEAEILWKVSH